MTPEEQRKAAEEAVKLLERQAKLQQQVSESYDDFIKGVKRYKNLQETINKLSKEEARIQNSLSSLTGDDLEIAKVKLKLLKDQSDEFKKQRDELKGVLVEANKLKLTLSKVGSESLKGFGKLPGFVERSFGKLKGYGLFEMEKSIKMSGLQMGILSKESNGFRGNIVNAAKKTTSIGIGVKDLAEMQSTYSDEIGRGVVLSEKGLIALGEMAASTVLGAEGSARMAADMEAQGISAERTGEFIKQTLNDSHKMGVNASKVIKNVSNNIKMLNKYNFKDGVKGLAQMAMSVSKMGVSMEFATGMADKLWDVEGAVDMAAQLQVMGGAWSQMADPFHLMYMARNDIKGLTEELGNAAAASAKFNNKTGEFDIQAKEMHKLKIIADQTGVSYDELVTAGKNVAKLGNIKSQIKFNMTEDEKEFITNKAIFDKNGKATIMIGAKPKLLSQLDDQDRNLLAAQMKETQSMRERAEQSKTFDEQVTYLIDQVKVSFLPLVKTMNDKLVPKLQGLSDKFESEGWGDKIESFAKSVGEIVSSIAGFVIEWPKTTAALLLFAKAGPAIFSGLSFLWDTVKWFKNGVQLGLGFNSVTSGGASSPIDGGRFIKGSPKNLKMMKGMKAGGIASLAGLGIGLANDAGVFGEEGSTLHKVAGIGSKALEWGGTGAMIGSMIAPGIGTAIGAAVGGLGGALFGAYNEGVFGQETHDGIFEGYKKGLSSEFSKGRGLIQGGKIHPIDNKDDLMALKPGGIIDKQMNNPTQNIIKHDFGELTINGELRVTSPGNPGLSVDLLKDPQFKRDIARTIQSELEKNRNGGKNKG